MGFRICRPIALAAITLVAGVLPLWAEGKASIQIKTIPFGEITERGKHVSSVGYKGKSWKGIKRTLHFYDKGGKEIRSIRLSPQKKDVPSPTLKHKLYRRIGRMARISKSGNFVAIGERSSLISDEPMAEGSIECSNKFKYYNLDGKLLWELSNAGGQINAFSLSEDGHRIGVIHMEQPTKEELPLAESPCEGRTWLGVYDEKGKELYRYTPIPGRGVRQVGLSKNGKYGVTSTMCFEVATGKTFRTSGSGFTSIDDNGFCSSRRYLRDFDKDGKQTTQVTDEHQF